MRTSGCSPGVASGGCSTSLHPHPSECGLQTRELVSVPCSSRSGNAWPTSCMQPYSSHPIDLTLLTPPTSPCSMFHGREASQRIITAWASHSLIAAVRLLLRDALADPLNKRFILMSGALCCTVLRCVVLLKAGLAAGCCCCLCWHPRATDRFLCSAAASGRPC